MKISPALKVGTLTIISLAILLFTILWIKGRSFSSAERIEVQFKDVNGMRPGSGVQMMGMRVGQVEEITPVVSGESSYVKMKFVITQPGIKIPRASTLSIQQSGLIGEQFLEITPPKLRTVYIPVVNKDLIINNSPVEIKSAILIGSTIVYGDVCIGYGSAELSSGVTLSFFTPSTVTISPFIKLGNLKPGRFTT